MARCLACGARIAGPLAALGSLRCSDCRSTRRSLDEALVRGLTGSRVSAHPALAGADELTLGVELDEVVGLP
jgi:hypothetical protein